MSELMELQTGEELGKYINELLSKIEGMQEVIDAVGEYRKTFHWKQHNALVRAYDEYKNCGINTAVKCPHERITMKKHWYFITIRECVLCGAYSEERERRYTEKPTDYWERRDRVEYACSGHFL